MGRSRSKDGAAQKSRMWRSKSSDGRLGQRSDREFEDNPPPTNCYDQMLRHLACANRGSRPTQTGEQRTVRSYKRIEFDHAASRSNGDILKMADSQTWPGPPRLEDRSPHEFRFAKIASEHVAAGVGSDRMNLLDSIDLGTKARPAKPVYAPPTHSDPITHKDLEDEEAFRDARMLEGAAGLRTDRLTYFASCNLTTQPTIKTSPFGDKVRNKRTDPISHIRGRGSRSRTDSSEFKFAQPQGGINRAYKSGSDLTLLHHSTKQLPTWTKQQLEDIRKGKMVFAPGEMLYNVAGKEDLLPPATKEFKADRRPSDMYRDYNERKYLTTFDRYVPGQRCNPALFESEDMYYAMCGVEHGRHRFEVDRMGRSCDEDEPSYGPNWVAIEIEKGNNGQPPEQRARSLEPRRSASESQINTGGSMTARSATRQSVCVPRSPAEAGPLKWPGNQQTGQWQGNLSGVTFYEAGSASARSDRTPQPFRTPNGVADWAGLNGLGIWKSAAMSTSPNRVKTPEPRSKIQSPALSASGAGMESRAAMDTTREKGAEFPRTPQFKVKSPEVSNGGSKRVQSPSSARRVQSPVGYRPDSTTRMRLGPPAVEVFSL